MVSLRGVIPAHLLPFTADLEIDEPQLRRHVRALLDVDGVTGITTNAHASEVATLTADEQRRVLDIVLDEAAGTVPVISGVYQDGSAKAARIAADAEAAGADALLVFPSVVFDGGSQLRPEMAFAHYAAIADATSLPMIAFLYPSTSGLRLGTDAVVRICSDIDNVVAVKEWSNDIVAYERNLRALRSLAKPVSVLSSFSRSLLASLVLGADGVLSGHGSLVVDLHVELWRAVEKQDLAEARRIWERIRPVAEVCYDDPFLDGHNRMKVALAELGRIDQAHVRPPLQPVGAFERSRIRSVVERAGLPRG
ncbi:dihydrodipicolinate synthase family protein [Pseudonocardia sp. KRD-184]|uniref:Dihydrodipicolinate synthase family protein n=1 Tax=Pseudonocardia oceani TaxID=2792013 RepID=A0ABS6UES4_9PSEU|nr:dihydrodipicolinate synthase family protein [Pseudonocardia oceani]MBW0093758.1 dihydrodipicolinate synthase family protein [Pseudonocardia oceani]MBW0100403.1 dihydrodipicolinate synthase family protein [Pseudonocardia oceani]MBW0113135.1 dihydrodipicolinate synthase family protein [Pseudonocardia oceani]MBW0124527.1 dihydrodipicolinate synthase family protein [Pseudonocardia oceani]MBW0130349.1 dihydrodipicolinate synthase family protein [Pseudonocardia oceani]